MEKKDIAVLVPIYRSVLSEDEWISLVQCMAVLSEYHIIIIKPKSLNIDLILSKYSLLKVESFPDEYFAGLRAYNKMVLDESFYLHFLNYQYVLIYQLDAYVFKDELLFWANKGYDYIGAPWIPPKRSDLTKKGRCFLLLKYAIYSILNNDKRKQKRMCNYQVGNGGFSLRRVSKMIEITHFYKEKINCYLDDDKPFYPEDVFLLLELTSRKCRLYKPNFKEALRFSIEENPKWGYHYNNKKLPFGCHDWNHKDYLPFWCSIIRC